MSIDRKLVLSRLLSFLATSDRPDGKAFIDLARIGQTLSNDQLVKDICRRKAKAATGFSRRQKQ
jgi:hypothetical protein